MSQEVGLLYLSAVSARAWAMAFSDQSEHARRFLEEAASDSVNLIALVSGGHRKSSFFLLRSYIENTLRHMYYWQHPVEYEVSCIRATSFITWKDLTAYLSSHPRLHSASYTADVLAGLGALYTELSLHVHSRRVQDSDLTRYLADVRFDEQTMRDVSDRLGRATSHLNCTLATMHRDTFQSLDPTQRSMIRRLMSPDLRRDFTRGS
jgi:hypothetical protein